MKAPAALGQEASACEALFVAGSRVDGVAALDELAGCFEAEAVGGAGDEDAGHVGEGLFGRGESRAGCEHMHCGSVRARDF